MIKKYKAKIALTLILIGMIVAGYSQSIDTTKFYMLTNVVLGESKAMTGMVDAKLGNSVMLRSIVDHPMQHWMIEPAPYGGYMIHCREFGRNYALEVINEGSNSKKISLSPTNKNASGQVWKVNMNRDGSYRIVSLWQEKAIDYISTGEQANQLTLTEIESSIKSQTWRLTGIAKPKPTPAPIVPLAAVKLEPVMDTAAVYKLTNQFRGTGFAMAAVSDGNGGIKPMLRETASIADQQWKFEYYAFDGGVYRLINTTYPYKSLDIINDGKQNSGLTLATSGNFSGQYWRVVANVDGSYWLISYWQRGNGIDVVNAGNKDELIVTKSGRFSGQLWKLTKEDAIPLSASSNTQEESKETPPPNEEPAEVVSDGGGGTSDETNTEKSAREEGENKSNETNAPTTNDEQVVTSTTEEARPLRNQLYSGQELFQGNQLVSQNGTYSLIQQADGNLVLYKDGTIPIWATDTYGKDVLKCVMQDDGNLVLQDSYDAPVWESKTAGNRGAYLMLQDEGVIAIFNRDNQIIWNSIGVHFAKKTVSNQTSSATNKNKLLPGEQLKENQKILSADGEYYLIQQTDGNLVVYNNKKKAVWASGMNGQNVKRCVMHQSGNLAQHPGGYDLAMWSTQTTGNNGAYALLQDDGVLVIINRDNEIIWRSENH